MNNDDNNTLLRAFINGELTSGGFNEKRYN